MALGNSDISVNAICAELGITESVERDWTELTSHPNINKWARYAPGSLDVDASFNTTLTAPTSNIKIGDFRSYNQASNTPSVNGPSQLNYGPGSGNISVVVTALPEQMNVWEYATPADTYNFKIYKTISDRTSEVNALTVASGNPLKDLTFSITTPPVGHTRSETKIVGSTQVSDTVQYNSATNGFSTPNQNLYGDCFLSASITGARRINLGETVSGGYFSFIAHQYSQPYVTATGNITPPPSGWTAAWIDIHSSSTPVCTVTPNINQTQGSSTYSFYVKIHGIDGSDDKVINATNCNVYLTHDGGKQLVHSGSLSHSAGTLCSGTLQNSNTWSYDEVGYITIENVTFGTSETTC